MNKYPLMENTKEDILTYSGKGLESITFESIAEGKTIADDCRISRSSLLAQAEIAEQSGNKHLAENFIRAAEMVDLPNERIIEIYNMLRPYRSTEQELESIIQELRDDYHAVKTADFIGNAKNILKERKRLKGDR